MFGSKLLVALLFAIAAIQVHSATNISNAQRDTHKSTSEQQDILQTDVPVAVTSSSTRTGRIMKILKEPKGNVAPPGKRNRMPQKLQPRRDRYPPGPQRPLPITFHRSPAQPQFVGGHRNQVLRRVQNGPPPNALHRPQQQQQFTHDPVKGVRFPLNAKENVPPPNFGKGAVFRPHYTNAAHPNALTSPPHSQQYLQNFKASPPFNGNAVVRPAPDYSQFGGHAPEPVTYKDIKQYPLPQQQPEHHVPQQQHQHEQQQQQQYHSQRPSANVGVQSVAPQTFPAIPQQPAKQFTEALLQSSANDANGQQMYSVYEDPEISEHAPIQLSSQQNQLVFNGNQPSKLPVPDYRPSSSAKEAEDYLKFMSTNEYFLPKYNPNYRKLDDELDQRQLKLQQKQQLLQYGKTLSSIPDASGSATFHQPIQVSQLFYHPNASPTSTIVRGSYQTGNNAFVVKSDGNKAVKHIVPNSMSTQGSTTPSAAAPSYTQVHFDSQRHRTPEPIRFEFTERDAVTSSHTNSPPLGGHLRYKGVNSINSPTGLSVPTVTAPTTTSTNYNHPIAVNEVDADPEDGDDMQEAGTDMYGRVPIRSSTENSLNVNNGSFAPTPATEQKDTEEYCERICANVQDGDEEVICGSDGYQYTGEAQMECYASCLHIDVTIQGKGSCSAR